MTNLRSVQASTALFSLVVGLLWAFPKVWYNRTDPAQKYFWLAEGTNIAGWNYREVPVAKSAERVLVADRLVNGEFTNGTGHFVRVFSARRYKENANEIGLFVHTPDRCWTEAGWKLESATPDVLKIELESGTLQVERRIFAAGQNRELVYFGGLTGGQPLPYRLDHNLSVGMRYQLEREGGTRLRAGDPKLWTRVWEAFESRRPLLGPKQFVRISTSVLPGQESEADVRLRSFLKEWLRIEEYKK